MSASTYLEAAAAAAQLLAAPEVAVRWHQPSALSQFEVSGLAGHLAWQITRVPGQLREQPPGGAELISLLDHYARVRWIGAPLDDELNVGIRRNGDTEAADGPEDLARRTAEAVAELRRILPAEPTDRVFYLAWTGWSLTLADFLTTRLLEIVIHIDDLAVSVDAMPPPVPDEATDTVLALLTRLAARRHGTAAVLRALSRQERAPATVAAF